MKLSSFLAIPLLVISVSSCADSVPESRHIQVVGSGYVEALPDRAVVRMQLSEIDHDPVIAKNRVDAKSRAIIDVAESMGLDKKHISATQISLRPEYEWRNREKIYKGEKVEREITLTLDDVSRYAELVHQLVSAGITRLNSTSLEFQDRSTLEQQAMAEAIRNARAKAGAIAEGFEVKLGGVHSISEQGVQHNYRSSMPMLAEMKRDSSSGFNVGAVKIHATVSAVFYLEDD